MPTERRKRILLCNDAHFWYTGYAKYGNQLLNKLADTEKFDLAELACYGTVGNEKDMYARWMYYANHVPPQHPLFEAFESHPQNQFGKWRFERVCLDFKPDIVCTPPGSLVLTKDGYKEIEKIKKGDIVYSHTGKEQKVNRTFKREYNGELINIRINGSYSTLKLTPEHPVLVYKKKKQTNQKKSIKKIYKDIKPEFIPAKEVRRGDLIVFPSYNDYTETSFCSKVRIDKYLSNYKTYKDKLYPTTHKPELSNGIKGIIEIDKNLATLIGYILSDGHISKSGLTITLTGDEREYATEVQSLIKKVFDLKSTQTPEKKKYCINVVCNSVLLSEFLKTFCDEPLIHRIIWHYKSKEIISGLLRGLFRGDGCYKNNTVSFCSTNEKLANSVRALCSFIGIATSINKCKKESKDAYNVEAYGKNATKLHTIIEKHPNLWGLCDDNPIRRSYRTQFVNNHMVSSVSRVRKTNYHGQVYNIEVDKDNSYIINQISVHNCDIRDPWMLTFEEMSPYREFYHWCFTGDTPVILPNGQSRSIQKISIGDKILNGYGNPTTVKNKSSRQVSIINSIKTSSWGIPIETTAEHKFFVIKNLGRIFDKQNKRYKPNRYAYRSNQAIQEASCNIQKGDMLIFPPIVVSNEQVEKAKSQTKYNTIHFATLIGYFLSEGTCDKHGHIRWSFHKNEEYATHVKNCLSIIYPNNKIEDRIVDNCRIVGINSKREVDSIWNQFYNETKQKIMPHWVFNNDLEFVKEVIKCMWRGDGCYVKNMHGYDGLEYFTNSRALALSLWQLLLRLKIITNVTFRIHHGHTGYRFFVYGNHAEALHNIVQKKQINFNTGQTKDRSWFDEDGWLITRVTNTNIEHRNEIVYDIEVSTTDHTFLAPYMVHNCIMPTVDSAPQKDEWLEIFASADGVFTYSDWGLDVLNKEGNGSINTIATAPPGCDIETFKPVTDKAKHRKRMGFFEDCNILGTIMRNQPRKLYPDLFLTFRKFIDKCYERGDKELAEKTFLYVHCSYPDAGWEIPELVMEYGLGRKTIFTYICQTCDKPFCSFFRDARTVCPNCNTTGAVLPNTNIGLKPSQLAQVINLFDTYIQYSVAEGFGMPQIEAAACGVPIMSVDYSAMSDIVRKTGGIPLKVERMFRDIGTNSYRALPDNEACSEEIYKFFRKPEAIRRRMGHNARKATEKFYTWDNTIKIWEAYLDKVELTGNQGKWNIPKREIKNPPPISEQMSNPDFINWAITNVMQEPRLLNSRFALKALRQLNYGGKFVGQKIIPVNKKTIYKAYSNYAKNKKDCELARVGELELENPDYIQYAHQRAEYL